MSRALRFATVALPVGFTLACTVGDGDLNDRAVWDVEIALQDGDCPVPTGFSNRWWAEDAWAEYGGTDDFVDPDNVEQHDPAYRFYGDNFEQGVDCGIERDTFTCDPAGEAAPEGRLHLALSGDVDDEEHLTGIVNVVGTTGDAPLFLDDTADAVWCTGTLSFAAERIIDPHVRTSRFSDDSCDVEGTVMSTPGTEPATLTVANNSTTRVEVAWIDPSGVETRLATTEPMAIDVYTTTIGAWFRLYNANDAAQCVGMVEVTDAETLHVVHGLQD